MYEVKTEHFSGPVAKLLELIEQKHLDITKVSLALVTADFLDYLEKLKQREETMAGEVRRIHRLIADFVVVAAQLILIKSKSLLPQMELTAEEEADINELEERIKLYKAIKEASRYLDKHWKSGGRSFSRELWADRPVVFLPAPDLDKNKLLEVVKGVVSRLKEEMEREELPPPTIISLSEKISEILNRLGGQNNMSLGGMLKEKERREIVALFLAVLHLIRDRLIEVEQPEVFGDVILKKI